VKDYKGSWVYQLKLHSLLLLCEEITRSIPGMGLQRIKAFPTYP
jgi:hypothetical protein